MRKVFLDDLPTKKYGNTFRIDWTNSIGLKVRFIYDDLKGEIEIVDCNNKKINTLYDECEYWIGTNEFINGKIAYVINAKKSKSPFKIGEMYDKKNGKGKVKVINIGRKNNKRSVVYKCFDCGEINEVDDCTVKDGFYCPVCSNKKVVKGINDLATTNPEFLKYVVNAEDAERLSIGSKKKVQCRCPLCGYKKMMAFDTLHRQGFGCNRCSDGLSYPSKFITALLSQLNVTFETEYEDEWSNGRRYDYRIENYKCIIEAHGLQHYEGGFDRAGGKNLSQEQANDKYKRELAFLNGYSKSNYVVLDCRKSNIDWIRNSVMNSKLPQILNFKDSDIDWLYCDKCANNSRIIEICKMWNSGLYKNTEEIAKKLGIHRSTVIRALNRGKVQNITDYNGNNELCAALQQNSKIKRRKVFQYNKNGELIKLWDSIAEASSILKLKSPNIINCCKGKQKTCGGYIWRYADEVDLVA